MNKCSIIQEIKRAEDSIQLCYKKVTELENKLNTRKIPTDQRRTIENELQEVRKLLATNEEHLSGLHGENRQSFAVAASLFFLIFLIYGLYIMFVAGEI